MFDPWSKVAQRDADACWPWTGTVDKDGYGVFKTGGRQWRAARWVLEQTVGQLGRDEVTRHTCDNRLCCNPRHLLRGAVADNAADMVSRGRSCSGERHWTRTQPDRLRRGEANHAAKLSLADVVAIRARYQAGARQVDLAAEFGVTQSVISAIVRRRIWSHVEESAA